MNELYNSPDDIIRWLERYQIKKYTLRQDSVYGFVVDVAGDVFLSGMNLGSFEVKFGNVAKSFSCDSTSLTSLLGAPDVVGGDFDCSDNCLKTLKYSPQSVAHNFYCHHNRLINLNGSPQKINGSFSAHHNKISSLQGSPTTIGGDFLIHENLITSFSGALVSIGGILRADFNRLDNLEHLPHTKDSIILGHNPSLGRYQYISDYDTLVSMVEKDKLHLHIDTAKTSSVKKL